MTEEIKTKEMGNMSLAEKMKRCEEIKSRYKKGGSIGKDERHMDDSRLTIGNNNNDSFMINSYHSPKKYHNNPSSQQEKYCPAPSSESFISSQQQQFTEQKEIIYNSNDKPHNFNMNNRN